VQPTRSASAPAAREVKEYFGHWPWTISKCSKARCCSSGPDGRRRPGPVNYLSHLD
jgi:hypothetical protein